MEVNFSVINQEVSISFIPLGFTSLEKLFKEEPIKKIENINIGLFIKDEVYIDIENYALYFPAIKYMSDITDFFSTLTDEQYSVYKLNIKFKNFTMLYDDDSYIAIGGRVESMEDYIFFHNLYLKMYNIYTQSGHELDEW